MREAWSEWSSGAVPAAFPAGRFGPAAAGRGTASIGQRGPQRSGLRQEPWSEVDLVRHPRCVATIAACVFAAHRPKVPYELGALREPG